MTVARIEDSFGQGDRIDVLSEEEENLVPMIRSLASSFGKCGAIADILVMERALIAEGAEKESVANGRRSCTFSLRGARLAVGACCASRRLVKIEFVIREV